MPSGTDTATLIDLVLLERLAELRVCLPGEIVSYDPARQEADVRPLVRRSLNARDGSDADEELPTIPHVPVAIPRGGGFYASLPLQAGDKVLLVFSDVSVDDLRSGRGAVAPSDRASHHLANAVCYPGGVWPGDEELPGLSATDLIIGEDGGNGMQIAPSGPVRLGQRGVTEEFAAQAQKVLDRLSAIVTGFNSHVHQYIPGTLAAVATAPPTTPLSSPASVAASNVKVD